MIGRQAKALSRRDIRRLLAVAGQSRTPLRDTVIVLLAVRAGLRACEIARLTWSMVLDPRGHVASVIEVRSQIAKRGSGRRVPMHPHLKRALATLQASLPDDRRHPHAVVVPSLRGGAMKPNSIVNWFVEKCDHRRGTRDRWLAFGWTLAVLQITSLLA